MAADELRPDVPVPCQLCGGVAWKQIAKQNFVLQYYVMMYSWCSDALFMHVNSFYMNMNDALCMMAENLFCI